MTEPITFCIDAGATRSRGRLYGGAGETLCSTEGGPANASYDGGGALGSVLALWRDLNATLEYVRV